MASRGAPAGRGSGCDRRSSLLLRGGRLVDARGARDGRPDLLIRDGRIATIGPDLDDPDAAQLDLGGRWIVPGLMNAHSHLCLDGGPDPEAALRAENRTETVLRSAARLEAAVRAGVTTIRDVGGIDGIDIELARLVDAGEIQGPRVIPSGRVVTMTGGHGWWMGLQADGPDAVRRATRENLRAGAGSIKLLSQRERSRAVLTLRSSASPSAKISGMTRCYVEAKALSKRSGARAD